MKSSDTSRLRRGGRKSQLYKDRGKDSIGRAENRCAWEFEGSTGRGAYLSLGSYTDLLD